MKPTPSRHLFAGIAAVFAVSTPIFAQVTVRSQGTYTDRDAAAHRWYVNSAHTLIWDDKPFVPVGVRFAARSWTQSATDADYAADIATLDALAARGITDVYVQPATGGIMTTKAASVQRLVDYLDGHDFTYGVSLNDAPRDPLIGYVVRPGAYRQLQPVGEGGGELRFTVPNATGGLYFAVNALGGDVRESGEAAVSGDTLRVSIGANSSPIAAAMGSSGQTVVFALPERVFTPGDNLRMPNLWDGFDTYRDSLITLLGGVKFGKGFRFVCDPLPADLALTDGFARVVPTSDAFRAEWTAYLGNKYRSLPNLVTAWGIQEPLIASFEDAAKLLPLWSGGKGVALFYNTKSKDRLRAAVDRSTFWSDLALFKAESVRGYMNDLAVTLKRTVADVPVVYRAGGDGWSELLSSVPATRGFDGMGMVATGRGAAVATRSAAYTFAQASDAPKTVWLPAFRAEGSDTAETLDKTALTGNLDWLREAGAKGFYADASTPETLDTLVAYTQVLNSTGMRTRTESPGAAQAPAAVFYPRRELPDLSPVTLTAGGGWWLPTGRAGQTYSFGATGRAYGIEEPGAGLVYYLWNPTETRRIKIEVPKSATDNKSASRVAWSANAQGELKKQTLTLTIGPEPVRLLNYPVVPVPQEAYPEARAEAELLIKAAKAAKAESGGRYAMNLDQIRVKKEDPYPGLRETLAFLDRLRFERRTYFWYDAEYAASHSFDEAGELAGASGNRVLRVDARANDAPPATAQFKINFGNETVRDVWLSMSPDALVSLRLDGRPLVGEATIPQKVGNRYADGSLVWTRFGTATIPRGEHILEIRADGAALIDALLLTRDPFTPDGANPPSVTP